MAVKQSIVEALTPVLEWLEKGGHHVSDDGRVLAFDMSNFKDDYYPPEDEWGDVKSCGTSCCIAGAVVQFNKHLFTEDQINFLDAEVHYNSILAVAEKIGMSRGTAAKLFYASDSDVSTYAKFVNGMDVGNMIFREGRDQPVRSLFNLRPEHAVKTLKGYLKTGRVKWPKI